VHEAFIFFLATSITIRRTREGTRERTREQIVF